MNPKEYEVLVLSNSENPEDAVHDSTLVGKILSDKIINFTAIKAILGSAWDLGSNV